MTTTNGTTGTDVLHLGMIDDTVFGNGGDDMIKADAASVVTDFSAVFAGGDLK
jgi:hypothetical protein